MRAALGRRPLDQGQPVRREDRDRGAVARCRDGVHRAAVEEVAPTLGPADRRQQPVLDAVLVADDGLGPRQLSPERDQVTPVGGPERSAGEGEVERLEEVRLADAVGADQADDPRPELDPRIGQASRGIGFDDGDQHRAAPQTLRRIGITR